MLHLDDLYVKNKYGSVMRFQWLNSIGNDEPTRLGEPICKCKHQDDQSQANENADYTGRNAIIVAVLNTTFFWVIMQFFRFRHIDFSCYGVLRD